MMADRMLIGGAGIQIAAGALVASYIFI